MKDQDEVELRARLAAMEARVPGGGRTPALIANGRRGRFAVPLAMAPVLVFALVAGATAGGAVVVSNLVRGLEGIQNPGQPLAGAHMECMSPPDAEAFLAAHGFTNVIWQVEGGDPASKTADGQVAITSHQQRTAPAHGYVVPGSILDDGSVIMIIDQRVGTTGVGDCFSKPMP